MKHLAPLALLAALAVPGALSGCDKRQAESRQAPASTQSTSPVSAASPVEPVKVMDGDQAAHASAAAGEHGGSCGDTMAEGGSCGGGEEGGGCNQWDEAAGEVARRPVPDNAEWKTIAVSGMTCGGCERRVIANLGQVEGILAVEADAELGQVRIAMAPGTDLRQAAVEKINSLGYKAQ